jgi:glycosyltransferase involved in cell wall biosynthesis
MISIIIATYNASKTLKGCLDSIVSQLTDECELLLIDGGSKDNTNAIIDTYGNKVSTHISEPDQGIYDAWNKGVKLSHGDWIMFVGADDRLGSTALNDYFEFLKGISNNCYLISSMRTMYDFKGREIRTVGSRWKWPSCQKGMPISHPGALHRKELFDSVGLFNIKYKIAGDYDLLMRCGKFLNAQFMNKVTINVYEGGVSDSYAAIFEYYKVLRSNPNINVIKAIFYYLNVVFRYSFKKILRFLSINAHL